MSRVFHFTWHLAQNQANNRYQKHVCSEKPATRLVVDLFCFVMYNKTKWDQKLCLDSVILTTAASGCPQCTLRPLWRTNGAESWHL